MGMEDKAPIQPRLVYDARAEDKCVLDRTPRKTPIYHLILILNGCVYD